MRNRSSIINNSVCANKRRITEGKNENVKTIQSNADCRHKLFFTNKYHKEFSIRKRERERQRKVKWIFCFLLLKCYVLHWFYSYLSGRMSMYHHSMNENALQYGSFIWTFQTWELEFQSVEQVLMFCVFFLLLYYRLFQRMLFYRLFFSIF